VFGFPARPRAAFAVALVFPFVFVATALAAGSAHRSESLDFDRDGRADAVRLDAAGHAVIVQLGREGSAETRYALSGVPRCRVSNDTAARRSPS